MKKTKTERRWVSRLDLNEEVKFCRPIDAE